MANGCRKSPEPRRPPFVGPPVRSTNGEDHMGRGILLWLIGVPIPVIILILLFWR
jgi:hypothetical protein